LNREEAAEDYRERNEQLYQTKQISLADRNRTNAEIEGWKKKIYDSPEFKDAEKYINDQIGKPKNARQNNLYDLTQLEFTTDMREASNTARGKFNPMAWAQENAPKYIKLRNDRAWASLVKSGVNGLIKFNKTKGIDKEASLKSLQTARQKNEITSQAYIDAVNVINDIPVETE
jgi:hypothetical protein